MPAVNSFDCRDLRDHGVEDHRDRRRNNHRDRARRGDQAYREALAVTVLGEGGKKQAADRNHGADRGVRHGAKQFRRRHSRHGKRPAYAADDRHHPVDDAIGDAAAAHDLAGQDEERHRQQRKVVEAAEHIGLDDLQRHVSDEQNRRRRGQDQHDEDRKAEDQEYRRQDEIDERGRHFSARLPGPRSWCRGGCRA